MADNVSVPFLDSKISIQDLKNLEKAGSLITIFRELKKIEKIKDTKPNEKELKDKSGEILLKDLEQYNKQKNNEYYKNFLNKEIYKQTSIKKFSLHKFEKEALKIFNKRRATFYDQYIYSLLRNQNKNLIYELYYQIESKESSINQLASKYSSGSEKYKLGVVGPISLKDINPKISQILISKDDAQINEPIFINDQWYIIQKETYIPAKYNDYYQNKICLELFEKDLDLDFLKFISQNNIN